jgi:hypothetical protein
MVYSEVYQHLPGVNEENHKKSSLRIACILAKIRTMHLLTAMLYLITLFCAFAEKLTETVRDVICYGLF